MFKVIDGRIVDFDKKVTINEADLYRLAELMASRSPRGVRAFAYANALEDIEQTLDIFLTPQ